MSIYKTVPKMSLDTYAASFGFKDGISNEAHIKLSLIIELLISNLVKNALFITSALKRKTIKLEHLNAVLSIMAHATMGKSNLQKGGVSNTDITAYFSKLVLDPAQILKPLGMSGGRVVLPSEYFGIDSGRYFGDVSRMESSAFAPDLSRAGIDIKMPMMPMRGGSDTLLSLTQIVEVVDIIKTKKKLQFRMGKGVPDVILVSILSNLSNLFKDCAKSNKGKKILTVNMIYNVLKANCKKYAHMSVA